MRGEVISSIELVLPENVVEAAYAIQRDVETKFQAVNCEEGTSSEITVFKLPDDSVKINITVTTIEPEDFEDFPQTSGFVETQRSNEADMGNMQLLEIVEDEKGTELEKIQMEEKLDDKPCVMEEVPEPTIHQRLTRQGIITTVVHPKTTGSSRKKSVSFCPSVGDKGLERQTGDSSSPEKKESEYISDVPEGALPCIDIHAAGEGPGGDFGPEEQTGIKDDEMKDETKKVVQDSVTENTEGQAPAKTRTVPARPRYLTGVWRQKKKRGLIRKVHTPSNSAVYVISKTGETPPHISEMLLSGDRKGRAPVYQSGLPSINELISADGELENVESDAAQPQWAVENDKNLPQKKRAAARVIDVQLDHSNIGGKTSVITLPSYHSYESGASGETKVIHIQPKGNRGRRGRHVISGVASNGISDDGEVELMDGKVVDPDMLKTLINLATRKKEREEEQERREGTKKRKYKREFIVSCRLCSVKVKDYGYLFRHVKHVHRTEPEMKSYLEEIRPQMRTPCPICGKLVSSISNINSHIKQCHAGNESAVQCPVCQKMYKTSVSLRQHLRQCHQPHQRRYVCEECPAKFTERRSLQEHINCTHETTEVFKCEDCGKTFLARGRLRRHRYIHGEFRHKCPYCEKGFHLKDNMNKHIEIVHEKRQGKRFACTHCGKRFSVKGNMTQHVLGVHLKQFQYECPNCGSGYRRKKELIAHLAKMSCKKAVKHEQFEKDNVELVEGQEEEEEEEGELQESQGEEIQLEIHPNEAKEDDMEEDNKQQ